MELGVACLLQKEQAAIFSDIHSCGSHSSREYRMDTTKQRTLWALRARRASQNDWRDPEKS